MSILEVIKYPNPSLRKKSIEVQQFDSKLERFAHDMIATMYDNDGIGLAAIQVNVPIRVIVIDISSQRNEPIILINPKIIKSIGERAYKEGCLSVPGFSEWVKRADSIHVSFKNLSGQEQILSADDVLATCIQHEMDHLEGKVFLDRLSHLKRQRIKEKISKLMKIEKRNLKSNA